MSDASGVWVGLNFRHATSSDIQLLGWDKVIRQLTHDVGEMI